MKNTQSAQWYIATTIIGSEDKIRESLKEKIVAYKFQNEVIDMRLIKHREITIEEFNDTNNPPQKIMRNSKNIEWRSSPKGYEKTTIKEINRFPGYLFINMIMTEEVWYMIRNTNGITGFVGSSGKGAKPIPVSEFEIEDTFNEENNKDKIIRISGQSVTEEEVEQKIVERVANVEYFDSKAKVSRITTYHPKENVEDSESILKDGESRAIENIEELNELIDDNIIIDKKIESYEVGNEITIINGALIGSTGLVKFVNDEKKTVLVEIELLGSVSEIELTWKDIVK